MNGFTTSVAQAARGDARAVPRPRLRPSTPRPRSEVDREHERIRSLARRLVRTANDILRREGAGTVLELTDESTADRRVLTLRRGRRVARLSARYQGETATTRLDGYGGRCSQAVDLAGAGDLERLAIGLHRAKRNRRPPDGHPAPFSRPRGAADRPRDDWLYPGRWS